MLKVFILCGCPGSGKTTWREKFCLENPMYFCLCPDEYRKILGKDSSDQSVSALAFLSVKQDMRKKLENNKSVIIDATNMYRKTRKQFLDIAKKYNAETIAVVFEVDRETLIKRNQKRGADGGRNVPVEIIDKMLSKYERPEIGEFDDVIMCSTEKTWTPV
jgi:predicted kinase